MRKANRRASKYSAKLDPSSLAERVARFRAYQVEHARTVTVRLASLESRAKALMSSWNLPVPLVLHYLNYVRELYRVLKTNTGWQARLLCYQLKEKWRSRGLDELKLFDLAYNLFHLKLWFHGAVLYLPFEAGRGTLARDYSNYGNNGTIYGAQWVAGKFGRALSFDGVDDYVEVPSPISSPIFTRTIWFKVLSLKDGVIEEVCREGGAEWFVSHRGDLSPPNWEVGFQQSDGRVRYWTPPTSVLYDGRWHFIAVVADGTNWYIYHNGELVKSGTYDGTVRDLGTNLFLGAYTGGTTRNINALIDEVLIYPRALTEEEIKRLALP